MSRFPTPALRVEFDGPDVSQEMLYTLFRVGFAVCVLRYESLMEAIWTYQGHHGPCPRAVWLVKIRSDPLFYLDALDDCHKLREPFTRLFNF